MVLLLLFFNFKSFTTVNRGLTFCSSLQVSSGHLISSLTTGVSGVVRDTAASPMSLVTEHSELSSLPSSVSSKATTPIDLGSFKEPVINIQQAPVPIESTLETPPPIPELTQPLTAPSEPVPELTQPVSEAAMLVSHPPTPQTTPRRRFDVRPKSSIPTDIPSYEYARQCIEAAESSRLNPYALHLDEYILLRDHITHSQVTTYLNLRNRILRLWIQNPQIMVTREDAVGCATARWFDVASVCYDWLVRHGYINFGCVETHPSVWNEKKDFVTNNKRKIIAVIGAGMSGLSCARQLDGLFKQYSGKFHEIGQLPPRVVVVEGRSRIGGRVYSREFKSKQKQHSTVFSGQRHTAEMGGMIVTGFERGNPMNILIRGQMNLAYYALRPETTIYDSDGKPVDPDRDQLVEKLYNDCLDRVSEFKYKIQPAKLIEGNRDLLDEGRDSTNEGSKSIIHAEEAAAAGPDAPPVSEQNAPSTVNMVPVALDKLTARVHNEPGTPAMVRAAEKAEAMGWHLKTDVAKDGNIDLASAADSVSATLGSVLDEAISQYQHLVDLNAQDYRLINWHIANLEYSNATNLHNLSLGGWDIDAGFEWEGKHTMIVGGYQSVPRGLLQSPTPLDLKVKTPVRRITYDCSGEQQAAQLECEDGHTIDADYIVCTIPLGVLKHESIEFDPPLPAWKTDVIHRLGFGVLNKVVLVYESPFWDTERDIFGVLRDAPNPSSILQSEYSSQRGRFFQWFNVSNTTGLPCLIALMAGDAGFDTEHTSNDKLITEATEVLRGVFGPQVPFPTEAIVTRWASDRFARGSYSSAAPDMKVDDYDVMARPVGNLHFAGEHTIGTHPATVHGAYMSGLRAASEILDALLGPIEVPTPLILSKESVQALKRKESKQNMNPKELRLQAYDLEIFEHIKSKIGERPIHPPKLTGNAFLLYCKANFALARRKCEETRRSSRHKAGPNEVRTMTSKMWKEASTDERKPYEDRAQEQKQMYADALKEYTEKAKKWDIEAIELREAYIREHPSIPGPDEAPEGQTRAQKHRRIKYVSYAESDGSDGDV
jgi:vacuolar protein sorting-associated protein 33A